VALGLRYRPWRDDDAVETTTRISARTPDVVETTGFDIVFPSFACVGSGDSCQMKKVKPPIDWNIRLEGSELVVTDPRRATTRIPLADLEQAGKTETDDEGVLRGPLVREGRWPSGRYRLYVGSIVFDHGEDNGPARVTTLAGILLLGRATPR
jgi:hypothetical protein